MKRLQSGYEEVGGSLLLLAVLVVGWLIVAPWTCHSKWGSSGMSTSWGPIQGCLVQTPSGRWVPEDRVRDVDLEPRTPSNAQIPK
jgi:hypothetical protein